MIVMNDSPVGTKSRGGGSGAARPDADPSLLTTNRSIAMRSDGNGCAGFALDLD